MCIGGVERSLAGVDVSFGGVDELGAFEDLPERKEGKVDRDANVGGDETVDAERLEDVESVEEDNDEEKA